MAKFDQWNDGSDQGGDGRPTPVINGGLLDPRTFPSPCPPATDFPSVDPQAPKTTGPSDSDVHAEVLRDILAAQAKLPPIPDVSLDRPPPLVNGPLMTDPHPEVFQNFMNALAGRRPVPPHPETWSIGGRPYLAIAAGGFDPSQSNGVTSMPTAADDAAAWAGLSNVAVPVGRDERTGYIAHLPAPLTAADVDPATGLAGLYRFQSQVLRAPGRPGGGDSFDTYASLRPAHSPVIHGHIDSRPDLLRPSDGMVDDADAFEGFGDADSLRRSDHAPTATVSHGQVGWHVLDNGQLKFLYPAGAMDSSQVGRMQDNLNREQRNLEGEQKKMPRPK